MCSTQFRSFALPELLPSGHVLVINQRSSLDRFIITELSEQACQLIAQGLFTSQEFYALVVLLESWPHYASYEVLLSALGDKTVEQARQLVHEAMEGRNLDKTLNPLRNLLARCRPRLHDFKMDVASIRSLGYQLVAYRE